MVFHTSVLRYENSDLNIDSTQATFKNQGLAPALYLEIPEDMNADKADVSIKWFLKGGEQVESETRKLEGDILYWYELPEQGRI